jgi:hypothetical protein
VTLTGINRRIEMRKIRIFTAAIFTTALILIGVGTWARTATPRVDASTTGAVDPSQLMTNAKNLPEGRYVDYTHVFN